MIESTRLEDIPKYTKILQNIIFSKAITKVLRY